MIPEAPPQVLLRGSPLLARLGIAKAEVVVSKRPREGIALVKEKEGRVEDGDNFLFNTSPINPISYLF